MEQQLTDSINGGSYRSNNKHYSAKPTGQSWPSTLTATPTLKQLSRSFPTPVP